MNELLVDLAEYKLQAKANFFRDMLINIVLAFIALGGLFLMLLASESTLPSIFAIGACSLVGSVVMAVYLYRRQRNTACGQCSTRMEHRMADVAAEDFDLTGGLVDHVRFTAYGRSYMGPNEEDLVDWVKLVQHVAICENCKRYVQLVPCQEEVVNENDTWVIQEHLHCDPVPMDICPGKTLTQFEFENIDEPAVAEQPTAAIC